MSREALRVAHAALKKAVADQDEANFALAAAQSRMKLLGADLESARAFEADEANERAASFGSGGTDVAIRTDAAKHRREIEDQIESLRLTLAALQASFDKAKQAAQSAKTEHIAAVRAVVDSEASAVLAKMRESEKAATQFRLELKALGNLPWNMPVSQLLHIWQPAASSLSAELAKGPLNVFEFQTRPLAIDDQGIYDRAKARWKSFSDRLMDDPDAVLGE